MAKQKQITWTVVADGAHAHIFETRAAGEDPTRIHSASSEAARALTHELGTEPPGRGIVSGLGRPHGMQPHADWHHQEAEKFATDLAHYLNGEVGPKKVDRLVVVAAPKTLAVIRHKLNKNAQEKVVAEFDKDLATLSDSAMLTAVRDLLRDKVGHIG